jgi:plastocyanin
MRPVRVCLLFAASFALAMASSLAQAQVTGKVKLDGKAPEPKEIDMSGVKECAAQHADPVMEETIVASEKGELANVVVMVKAEEAAALGGEVPKETAVLDQKGCQYVPHVMAMMVGQKMAVKNDDPFLHNVHSLAQTNPAFNFGQPNKDPGKAVDPPKASETIKIKCDVHPWMSAWIIVLDHPFFAVSKPDGSFEIKGLPDGDYTLQAWHEKLGTQESKVSVKGGKAEANFTFKPEGAQANPNPSDAKLASSTATMECCEPPSAATAVVKAASAK